jgi:hypothetical protein
MTTYISGVVAIYSRDRVLAHSPSGKITKAALRDALRTEPEKIDFRTDSGYANVRDMVRHHLTIEVRDGYNLVAIVEAQRTESGVLQAVVR